MFIICIFTNSVIFIAPGLAMIKVYKYVRVMVLILDGNSEIVAQMWSDLGFVICIRLLYYRSREATNLFFSPQSPHFLYTCAHVLTYHLK